LLREVQEGDELALDLDGHLVADPSPSTLAQSSADDALVGDAHAQAAELVRQAAEQAAAIQHDAYREGRAEGERDGRAAARSELVEALALVQHVAANAKSVHDRLLLGLERDIVELVIEATRVVIGEHVRRDPTVVLDTIERALARAGAQNVVRVRVHPDDMQVLAASLAEGDREVVPWEAMADGAVAVGGCIVDTAGGEVDARLDVQLEEVARALREIALDADGHDSAEWQRLAA
jgi:flagellar assembly protein FliH